MKRWIHASTDNELTFEAEQIFGELEEHYEILETIPEADDVFKGDTFIFKVNDNNIYQVTLDIENSHVYLNGISEALSIQGEWYYQDAFEIRDQDVELDDMTEAIVSWVNEFEQSHQNFTKYEERDSWV